MNYIELKIEVLPLQPAQDVLMHKLGEVGFESFTEEDFGLLAYIPQKDYNKSEIQEVFRELEPFVETISFAEKIIEQQNWNEVWESNFEPIEVDDRCIVKAPFHNIEKIYPYTIEISPKMSFGTGHHETTFLMLSEMLEMNWQDKMVLDMGSGTGILAILASKLGAKHIDAIDIEEWAYENAKENFENNDVKNAVSILGDANQLEEKETTYDVVLANINRNILMQDMEEYVKTMKPNAEILFSGFYDVDVPILIEKTNELNLELLTKKTKNSWCMLHFKK